MRKKRLSNRYKASWVAGEMGISASLLCLLEKDKRTWSESLKQRFLKAIGEA